MRLIFFSICFLLIVQGSFAQTGNEWIKYNQFYFKIPIARDGLYRLTYGDLQSAGFPTGAVDPQRLQLFHRGVEQAIYIEGQSDSKFDATDFIEFYGTRNDGTQDVELYDSAALQPHPYYNLYNDTTSYFLTYNLSVAGKRMDSFFNVKGSLTTQTYHLDEKLLILKDTYAPGQTYFDYVQSSYFDNAEGWCGVLIRQSEFVDYTLTGITQTAIGQGLPQLEVLILGRSLVPHEAGIQVGQNGGSLRNITTVSFFGYTTTKFTQALNWSDIGADGKLTVRIKANGSPDRLSVGYIKLTYPQQYNAAGASEKYFNLNSNVIGKSYIEIQNPAAGFRLFDVTDPATVSIIGTQGTAPLTAVVRGTSVARKLLATNNILTPTGIKSVVFRQIIPAQHNYIIISNRLLMKPALGYSDVVKAYAEYRASVAGGKYDTLVVDVNQLYDQFNYGETSPLAIFHFMKFLCASHKPDYLFIIGKGLNLDYQYYRNPSLFPKYKDFVPTAGLPPSDMYFTVGLAGTKHEPAVPTGRITATNPAQIASYLNKVKEMEALPFDALWRKNILHLSGGLNANEPELFKSYAQGFQTIAEGNYLGGKVKAIAKRTTDIQLINISEEVNKGLNLVTFFGHSSPSTIDFDIGYATNPVLGYNNPGKYPTLLMNGCNAGAFFLNDELFGEDWVNAANKGAIGFIAHSSYGLITLLKNYTDLFYTVGYRDSIFIHKGIGDIQKEVARLYQNTDNPPNASQIQQMILLGDPAVSLFGARKPDYEINDNNVFLESFDGSPITALTDSFAINIIVRNFGQAKKDSLVVAVTRTFNDNSSETYHQLFPPVKYSDTLSFTIYKNTTGGFGTNKFSVKVDSDNDVPELNENNNVALKDLLIPLNGTKNLFPSDYAIVNNIQPKLVFQTTNLLSGERNVLVEIDTVDSFNSGYKKQFTVKGSVLFNQSISILSIDTLAYYWRTKLKEPLNGESTTWTVSSFTYINNGTDGWAQVHFPQYLKNESIGLVRDATLREFKFEETKTDISIKTFGASNPASFVDVSIKLNNAEYNLSVQGNECRNNSINLLAFSKTSTVPYPGVLLNFSDARTCGRQPKVINNYLVNELETGSNDVLQWINNIIPGDSVVIFSIGNAGYSAWSSTVKNKFGELGVSVAQLASVSDGDPIVIFGKKGAAPGTAKLLVAVGSPANAQTLQVDQTITGRYTSGKMKSVLIGPAKAWKNFINKKGTKELNDQFGFDIFGIKLDQTEILIKADVTTDTDLTDINATTYPYLKLVFKSEDDLNLTPLQLKKWLVLYEPVAEGIIIYKGSHDQQTLQEGQVWNADYSFVNISDKTFSDSLTVHTEVFNKTERTLSKIYSKIKAPAPADTTDFSISINTTKESGLNDLNVFVNPYLLPELYYDNNLIQLPSFLNVLADIYEPVLDVTVDGRYLISGDFVSPNPKIVVKLWDENRVVFKKDTLGLKIFLRHICDSCNFEPINFTRADVKWYPATDTTDFAVYFTPTNLTEGDYELVVCRNQEVCDYARVDVGEKPYQVTFKVKYEQFITLLSPYPNPSESAFHFSFTVSGQTPPDFLRLQITSVDGRLLYDKQLTQDNFHIGINELIWDGTDPSGTAQPSGVYIFKFLIKDSNQEIRKNGKLVLVHQ